MVLGPIQYKKDFWPLPTLLQLFLEISRDCLIKNPVSYHIVLAVFSLLPFSVRLAIILGLCCPPLSSHPSMPTPLTPTCHIDCRPKQKLSPSLPLCDPLCIPESHNVLVKIVPPILLSVTLPSGLTHEPPQK